MLEAISVDIDRKDLSQVLPALDIQTQIIWKNHYFELRGPQKGYFHYNLNNNSITITIRSL